MSLPDKLNLGKIKLEGDDTSKSAGQRVNNKKETTF